MQTNNNLKKYDLKKFLLADIKTINKYLLIIIILVILTSVGVTSYALFSYEVESKNIELTYGDITKPNCIITEKEDNTLKVETSSIYEMNCTDKSGILDVTLTSNDFLVVGDITISNITRDVITNGYKYSISILGGVTSGSASFNLKESVISDVNGNYNNVSNTINIMLVSDITAPTITLSKTGGNGTATINATIEDTDSGITGYAITESTDTPTSWTTIENTTSTTASFTKTSAGTYYVHAIDGMGNAGYQEVVLSLSSNSNCSCSTAAYCCWTVIVIGGDGGTSEKCGTNESHCGCSTYAACWLS